MATLLFIFLKHFQVQVVRAENDHVQWGFTSQWSSNKQVLYAAQQILIYCLFKNQMLECSPIADLLAGTETKDRWN